MLGTNPTRKEGIQRVADDSLRLHLRFSLQRASSADEYETDSALDEQSDDVSDLLV